MKQRLAGLLERITNASIVVAGDVMLDEYIIGDAERISPESPHPIVDERERAYVPGGAANVAVNAAAIGAHATLFSVIGDDPEGEAFRCELASRGVDDGGVITADNRPTTRKTRLIARGTQVFRADRETRSPIDAFLESSLVESIAARPEDVIVISDYAKGLVTPGLVAGIVHAGKRAVVDPKSSDFGRYRGAYLITPNYGEFCRAAGIDAITPDEIEPAGRKLMAKHRIANLLVTLGADGMLLIEGNGPATHIHTRAREVYDVTGAGDTVVATLASALAGGAVLTDACLVANIAAGIVVGKHRTATASPAEIMDYAFGPSSSAKIVDRAAIARRADELRSEGRKIVFTNGCFDLLHIGHITYLNEARGLGDILVVGLNTDDSVRRLKGPSRPIINEAERSHVLAALECIDFVVPFDEDTPLELIRAIRPDILVKGADYTRDDVVGHDVVESWGGEVRLIPVVPNTSTSDIIRRIRDAAE